MTFEEVINTEGKLVYRTTGTSMHPLIREGKDIIVINKISSSLKINDVVLFIRPDHTGSGRYVLHRIRRINDDATYFIIGDNSITGEIVNKDNILGILSIIYHGSRAINVEDKSYIVFVKLWWLIFPIRMFFKKVRYFASRLIHKKTL